MFKYIETHCHLDYLKNETLDEILKKSHNAGVEKIITISVEPDNFEAVAQISHQYKNVYYTQGIHPHDAIKSTPQSYKMMISKFEDPKMVAIGEIGLDYHYDYSPRDIQAKVFKEQLNLAIQYNKPIVIHSREADHDMINILKSYAPKLDRKGVVHSFTSTKELAKVAMDLGFMIGFNGIVTFKNAKDVQEVLKYVPLEKMLLETDAPFLTPTPHRGKENAPYYLPFIAEKIAELKNKKIEEVCDLLYSNAQKLFNF